MEQLRVLAACCSLRVGRRSLLPFLVAAGKGGGGGGYYSAHFVLNVVGARRRPDDIAGLRIRGMMSVVAEQWKGPRGKN